MSCTLMRSIALLAVFASPSFASAQGSVLVVDWGGEADFTEIQEAVLAAQDGDTILVRPPPGNQTYQAFTVAAKGLTIVADTSTGFAGVRGVRVLDLPAGKTVVLSRLSSNPLGIGIPPGNAAIWLQDNAGHVRLVSCRSRGMSWYGSPGITIESSSGPTALAACEIEGGLGGGGDEVDGFPGGTGLHVEDAVAAVYDTPITGGEGGPLYIAFHAGPGGAGAVVQTYASLPTRLLLANSSITGGQGGELVWCDFGSISGPGGAGLVLGSGALTRRLATTFTGGAGGTVPPCGTPGLAGFDVVDFGILQSNPSTPVRLTTPTVAREGQTITLTITGAPGDRVTLVAGQRTTFRELLDGALVVQPGPSALHPGRGSVGTIDASGILTVAYAVPSLPAGIEAADLWFQALARHASGKRTVGSFSVVTVLDSAF